MASLVKIGSTFLNLDQVLHVDDLYHRIKENKMVLRFGPGEENAVTLAGQDADDLRTWLNSVATNLQSPSSDLDNAG
jgi:hypothetical protein